MASSHLTLYITGATSVLTWMIKHPMVASSKTERGRGRAREREEERGSEWERERPKSVQTPLHFQHTPSAQHTIKWLKYFSISLQYPTWWFMLQFKTIYVLKYTAHKLLTIVELTYAPCCGLHEVIVYNLYCRIHKTHRLAYTSTSNIWRIMPLNSFPR